MSGLHSRTAPLLGQLRAIAHTRGPPATCEEIA